MTKKEQLYYMLRAYKKGEYDIPTFCDAYLDIFYPETPKNELSSLEFEVFDKVANLVSRYSPYEEDRKLDPRAFSTDEEVNNAIEMAIAKLLN